MDGASRDTDAEYGADAEYGSEDGSDAEDGSGSESEPESYAEGEYGEEYGDEPPEGDEGSFFGMQSEGVAVTGLALGPGVRRLGRVCIAAALGLGVLFWTLLVFLYAYRVFFQNGGTNPDMPHLGDDRPWTAYYLAGALWAVGIGVWALLTRGGYARLTWCFACLVTAFFWPLGIAASLAVVAVRGPGAAMSRRLLLSGLAVLVAAGGLAWRVDAPHANPKQVAVGSDGDLLGTWRSRSGMSVELRSDGTFAATTLTGGGLRSGDPIPASAGRWDEESADGHSGVRLLVDGELSNSLWFDLYQAGPDLVLCSSDDPDTPCEVVLRRF